MKKSSLWMVLSFIVTSSFAIPGTQVDLKKEVKKKRITTFNRELTLIEDGSRTGVHLNKAEGEGVAWLKGVEFANGIIEFDVRGENVQGHSFVGIAFHGKDNYTFDAIYLRPFRFLDVDPESRSHSLQYVSFPTYTWRELRGKFPGKYEASINPSPEPDSWVKVKIVVKGKQVFTYINGNDEPSLVVEKVTDVKSGTLGFYVADTSGGDFANLTITKTE
jgi:hypothetical protein